MTSESAEPESFFGGVVFVSSAITELILFFLFPLKSCYDEVTCFSCKLSEAKYNPYLSIWIFPHFARRLTSCMLRPWGGFLSPSLTQLIKRAATNLTTALCKLQIFCNCNGGRNCDTTPTLLHYLSEVLSQYHKQAREENLVWVKIQ